MDGECKRRSTIMKKKVIKMRVCLGFDCNPRLDIISYEDEVTPEGMVHQTTKGVRNEKTLVKFGQTWMRYDSASASPYWDAYAILDAEGATETSIASKAMELFGVARNETKKGLDEALERWNCMEIPDLEHFEKKVHEKMNAGVKSSDGRFIVPVDEFKRLIAENVQKTGRRMSEEHNLDVEKWDKFYSDTLTPEILSVLMKGLPVLKFTGDGIEFQTKDMYEQALGAVSMKVSSDVFARFVETIDSQAK